MKPTKDNYEEKRPVFPLGEKFKGIYFTEREAECAAHLLTGKSIHGVAEALELAVRTVEYYVANMRQKLNCKDKPELITKVLTSDLKDITVDCFNKNEY